MFPTSLDRKSMENCNRKHKRRQLSKQFGKRLDSMVFEPGDSIRSCKRDNVMNTDLKGKFIEQGKIVCKNREMAVLAKKIDVKILEKHIRNVKKIPK